MPRCSPSAVHARQGLEMTFDLNMTGNHRHIEGDDQCLQNKFLVLSSQNHQHARKMYP